MKFKLLCLTVATCISFSAQAIDVAYEKKMGAYMVHLKDMQAEADRMKEKISRLDASTQACLKALKEKQNKLGACIAVKKDVLDYKHEYKYLTSYNRVKKVPKFERALQDMIQMEVFRLPKEEANALYKQHMEAKTKRQENIAKIGKEIYDTVDFFNDEIDKRLDEIEDLK